jgi:hypothetical protein
LATGCIGHGGGGAALACGIGVGEPVGGGEGA